MIWNRFYQKELDIYQAKIQRKLTLKIFCEGLKHYQSILNALEDINFINNIQVTSCEGTVSNYPEAGLFPQGSCVVVIFVVSKD